MFCLTSPSSAGKSTLLSTIAGISSLTSGSITFAGGAERPPRGVIGIVPQKNVLFPQLTCLQTLRVWRAVKWSKDHRGEGEVKEEDLVSLLKDCDLVEKKDEYADTLSGGQKRKLQLAIGLLGGSKSTCLPFLTDILLILLKMFSRPCGRMHVWCGSIESKSALENADRLSRGSVYCLHYSCQHNTSCQAGCLLTLDS